MRVLVTGASGFIGRQVVDQLAFRDDVEVVAVARGVTERPSVQSEAVDLLEPGAALALVKRARPTHLLHLAWNAKPGQFWTDPDNLDWCASSLSLVRAFASCGGQRIVVAGTCAEYAWSEAVLEESKTPTLPGTLYGVSKDALRRVLLKAADTLGVSIAWGRIFWLYGPGEPGGRLVSDVARALCAGQSVETTSGLQARDFLHVADVAGAFVAALNCDYRGVFNVGSGQPVPVRDVITLLGDSFGRRALLHIGARQSGQSEPPSLSADTHILRGEIGFTPRFDLQTGIAETAAWWRAQS